MMVVVGELSKYINHHLGARFMMTMREVMMFVDSAHRHVHPVGLYAFHRPGE